MTSIRFMIVLNTVQFNLGFTIYQYLFCDKKFKIKYWVIKHFSTPLGKIIVEKRGTIFRVLLLEL